MAPGRFPFALGIGTDICHVPRIARIITRRDEGGIERFANKIFNAFERKIFHTRLQRYRAARDAARAAPGASKRTASDGEVAALNAFARWVAGRNGESARFAAKEAAIKAVTRRLYYRDVTVLVPVGERTAARKPYALIDPPARTIRLSRAVALQRGVAIEAGAAFVLRPQIFRWGERQMARLSISHDGEYATATVLAADDHAYVEREEVLVDDGKGKPMHVPSLGDAFARMYDVQLNEFVRRGEMARLRELEEGRGDGTDAELLDRLRELRAELVARRLSTELVDDQGSAGDEQGEGV